MYTFSYVQWSYVRPNQVNIEINSPIFSTDSTYTIFIDCGAINNTYAVNPNLISFTNNSLGTTLAWIWKTKKYKEQFVKPSYYIVHLLGFIGVVFSREWSTYLRVVLLKLVQSQSCKTKLWSKIHFDSTSKHVLVIVQIMLHPLKIKKEHHCYLNVCMSFNWKGLCAVLVTRLYAYRF